MSRLFRRRARADREFRKAQQEGFALLRMLAQEPAPFDTIQAQAPDSAPEAAEPDFLLPDFQAPSRQDAAGFMMRWDRPLVIDGEVHACPTCTAYRNWVVFNMRDGAIWLRCQAGHYTHEPRLDSAWYNRNSGPTDRYHPNLEDGLRHLGH